MKKYSIGIDIGGMSIKVGLVDEKGVIVCENRTATASTADECIKNIVSQINDLFIKSELSLSDLKGIGIGCPGAVSPESGVVNFLPNLGWNNVPLVDMLHSYFDTKIVIANDASVAALAETIYGVAKDYNNCVMFTLGTGVGGGVILNKKIYDGGYGRGGELGHVVIDINGEPCTCGRRGCIETLVSATALIKQTKKAMFEDKSSSMWTYAGALENVNGKTAFYCAKQGDKTAMRVVDEYCRYLSESIMGYLNIFRPDVFILGGGISKEGEYLTEKVTKYCEKFSFGYKFAPKTKILTAKLGNDAGIIGASALV